MIVHIEAITDLQKTLKEIHQHGMRTGVAIKPSTELSSNLDECIEAGLVEMVLVMTVEPGFGGQAFMPETMSKVQYLRNKFQNLDIQVDGGIKLENVNIPVGAGANVIVSGTGILNTPDHAVTISQMKSHFKN